MAGPKIRLRAPQAGTLALLLLLASAARGKGGVSAGVSAGVGVSGGGGSGAGVVAKTFRHALAGRRSSRRTTQAAYLHRQTPGFVALRPLGDNYNNANNKNAARVWGGGGDGAPRAASSFLSCGLTQNRNGVSTFAGWPGGRRVGGWRIGGGELEAAGAWWRGVDGGPAAGWSARGFACQVRTEEQSPLFFLTFLLHSVISTAVHIPPTHL